jgi:flagellar biosynthesis protein FliP
MTFDATTLAVVVAVIGIAGYGLHALRTRGLGGADAAIRLIASRALGTKRALALVEVEGARFLLGLTDERITCLGRLDDAREPAQDRQDAPPARRARGVPTAAIAVAALLLVPMLAHAAPQLSLEIDGDGDRLSTGLQLVLLLTLLSFAPAILIGITAFVRIVIVLAFVRQAVGTQQMPPNQVIVALALFVTCFVMMPTMRQVHRDALVPYLEHDAPAAETIGRAFGPLREFMMRQTREKDLALFLGISGAARPATPSDVPPEIVIPAFMISELKTAFQISFMVYVPFLVLDMVVASILTSMGMITLPPVLISLPFKLMIFVLVDGWNLLVESLIRSFH